MFLGTILIVLLSAAGLTWVNYTFLVPSGGDDVFAPLWEAARYVLAQDGSPYTPEAVRRASTLLSDSPVTVRFLYPAYVLPWIFPFALIDSYSLARAVWMTVLFGCLMTLAFSALSLTRWRPKLLTMLAYLVFAWGSVPAVRAAYLGNPAVLAAFFVAFGLLLIVRERYGGAGFILGVSIIKPQMVIFLLFFVLLWAVSKRYMQLVRTMTLTVLVLVGGGIAISPLWLVQYYYELLQFFQETFPASFAAAVWAWLPARGPWMMGVAGLVLFGWLLVEWWRALGKDTRQFLWTASLTLSLTCLFVLPSSISNQVVLLIPFTLVFSLWAQRFQQRGNLLSVVVMILLTFGEWMAYILTMNTISSGPANVLMLTLRPVSAVLLLYWVRYWALNSVMLKGARLEALRRL